jgi:hypothetical protein
VHSSSSNQRPSPSGIGLDFASTGDYGRALPGLGRRKINGEVFQAIQRMAKENPSWGAPRIHGELLKLGFDVSERTVSRYLARRTPGSDDARQK